MKRSLVLITGLLLSFFSLHAQNKTDPKYQRSVWLEAGAGLSGEQVGGQVGLNIEIVSKYYLSLEYDVTGYVSIGNGRPWTEAESRTVSLGYLKKWKAGIFYVSAGPSWVTGTRGQQGSGKNEDYSTIGLKLKLGVMLSYYTVGIGISPYVNINPQYTYAGLTLNAALGSINIRKKS